MPYYNFTQMMTLNNTVASNQTSMLSFIQGVNTYLMFGQLGNLLLIGIFAILLISFYLNTGDFLKGFASASYITFILAISFSTLGLCDPFTMVIAFIASAIGVAVSFRE